MRPPDDIPPVSKTAFYCCGIREQDAKSAAPLLNDVFAERFMTPAGRRFYDHYRPGYFARAVNFVRPKLIENRLQDHLRSQPNLRIIQIGAGFDSRAFRLAGGRWLEFDEPAIIEHKEKCLPAVDCPNPLKRVPIQWERDDFAQLLAQHREEGPFLVIVEGVLMYLTEEQIQYSLGALGQALPEHTLLCDVMTHFFVRSWGYTAKRRFAKLGADILCPTNRPEDILLENGYRLEREISVYKSAVRLGAIWAPPWPVPPGLRRGYRVLECSRSG